MKIAELYDPFALRYIRLVQFAAAQPVTMGHFGWIYRAFIGNSPARQIFIRPIFNGRCRKEVVVELFWQAVPEPEPKKYVGQKPLAQAAVVFFMTQGLTFMLATGRAPYAEGAGQGSWPWAGF